MGFIARHKLTLLGILIGAVAGYLYFCNIGCANGSCAITSKPLNSTFYGAMMGGLAFSLFEKDRKKN